LLPLPLRLPCSTRCRDGRLFLRLDWDEGELEAYDQHAWSHPVVDASASPEAMQPTLDIIEVGGWAGGRVGR
jgi:hypothetical protein